MRLTCFTTAFLILSVLLVRTQTGEKTNAEGRITGTVLDQRGQPVQHIFVHAVQEKTGMYMATADSDDAGQFAVEGLEPGTYDLFGESDAVGYPNTAQSFYGNQNRLRGVALVDFASPNKIFKVFRKCDRHSDRRTTTRQANASFL